jgi:hypothetical protein
MTGRHDVDAVVLDPPQACGAAIPVVRDQLPTRYRR